MRISRWFAAVSNIQMSTFSPLAYRIQTGPLSRRVRFARIAYFVDEVRPSRPSARSTTVRPYRHRRERS